MRLAALFALVASLIVTRPVLLVVRHPAGDPLEGITLRIAEWGQPDLIHARCTTDSQGQCALDLTPGAYSLVFESGPDGQLFIPADQQNAGPPAALEGLPGGFGIQVEPGTEVAIFLFVVDTTGGDELVPLWDMAATASDSPAPYRTPGGQDVVSVTSFPATPIPQAADPAPAPGQNDLLVRLVLIVAIGLAAFLAWQAVVPRREG
jgi:hypothetical protein